MYLDEFNTVTDEMDNFDDALKARDAMRQKTSRRRKNEIKKIFECSINVGYAYIGNCRCGSRR